MTFSKTATAACALVLLASTDGFLAPAAPRAATSSTTTMKATNGGAAAAAAAALAAGVVLGSGPVDAAMFEGVSSSGPAIERSVGWGQPNPSSNPAQNNAANGGTEGSKYSTKQWGGFADKFSKGGGVDYGSAKGTDFGDTAGNAAGEVADDNTSTLKDVMKNSKGAVAQRDSASRYEAPASKSTITSGGASTNGDGVVDSAKATAERILGDAPATAADAASNALKGTVSVSAVDIGDIGNKAQQLDRQAKSAVGNAVNDATPSTALGEARAVGSQIKGAVQDARNSGGIGGNDAAGSAAGKARDLDRSAKSGARDLGNKAQQLDRQAKSAVGGAIDDATPNDVVGAARSAASQVKGAVQDARNSGGIGGNDAAGKARDLDRSAKSGARDLGNKAQQLDRRAKNAVGGAVNDATPNDIVGAARSAASQVQGAINDATPNNVAGKARDLDRQAKSKASSFGNSAQQVAGRSVADKVSDASSGANYGGIGFAGNTNAGNEIAGKARDLDRQAKGAAAGAARDVKSAVTNGGSRRVFGKAPQWQYGQGSNAKQAVGQVAASVDEATR